MQDLDAIKAKVYYMMGKVDNKEIIEYLLTELDQELYYFVDILGLKSRIFHFDQLMSSKKFPITLQDEIRHNAQVDDAIGHILKKINQKPEHISIAEEESTPKRSKEDKRKMLLKTILTLQILALLGILRLVLIYLN